MTIKFKCPSCSMKLQNDDNMGGMDDNCPGCGGVFKTPLSKEQIVEKKRIEKEQALRQKTKLKEAAAAATAAAAIQKREAAAQKERRRQIDDERRMAAQRKKESIIISTGSVSQDHSILQIIFAAGVQKFGGKGFLTPDSSLMTDQQYNSMIEEVYNSAMDIFRNKAVAVGADAIIHARFDIEQIELAEKGLVTSGNALRIQVFCTGTAVKFI